MDAEEIDIDLEEELTEFAANPEGEKEDVEESVESKEPVKRGRKAIPLQWLTVISLDHDPSLKMIIREIATDMALAQAERIVPNNRRERVWTPIFCPRKFVSDLEAMDLD